MWSLWGSRNDRKHGKAPIPLKHAIDWAMDVHFHLIKALDREKQGHKPRREQQWQKPVMGYLKINLDDAFDVFFYDRSY
jgi:hypothetical protein